MKVRQPRDLPAIDPATADVKRLIQPLTRMREELRELMGLGSGPGAVLWAQMMAQGIVRPGGADTGSPGVLDPGGAEEYEPDFTPPPTPTGLVVTALMAGILVEFDAGAYTQGHGPQRVNVYVASRNPATDPSLTTFSDATRLYEATHPLTVAYLPIEPGTRVHVWIKHESNDDVESVAPAGGVNGAQVTVGKIDGAQYFLALSIGTALIGDLAVTNAKIASVSVAKLLAGSIAVGAFIQSPNYVSGSAGWTINGSGFAEFSGVVVRGTIYATAGLIGGLVIGSGDIRSSNYVPLTSGFRLTDGGAFEAANAYLRGELNGGAFSGWAWPSSGGGFHLGPNGLLMGNANGGGFVQILANGDVYAGPSGGDIRFALVDGNLTITGGGTFGGNLSAAGGTFAGSLTAAAVDAVNTVNIAGQAVTTTAVGIGTGASASTSVVVPAGQTYGVLLLGFQNGGTTRSAVPSPVVTSYTVSLTGGASVTLPESSSSDGNGSYDFAVSPCAVQGQVTLGAGTHTLSISGVSGLSKTIIALVTKR